MSWTRNGLAAGGDSPTDGYGASALHVVYRTFPQAAHSATETSLSPLLHRRYGYSLRLYGIVPQDFVKYGAGDALEEFRGSYSDDPHLSDWGERYFNSDPLAINKRVGYLEPTDRRRAGAFPGVIVVDKNSETRVLHETCIPSQIKDLTVTYTVLKPDSLDPTKVVLDARSDRSLDTLCGECQVLELPDKQGYLMVFQQYLVVDADKGGYNPYNSRTQIVGWWSDTKEFTSENTVGPFLLVGELDCLPDQGPFRMWIGVPGVVAIRDQDQGFSLYLYYVVEESKVGTGDPFNPTVPYVLRDEISQEAYDGALDEWVAANTVDGKFTVGVYCKRINWNVFQANYIAPELASGLSDTTDIALWDTRDTVEGELLGLVNFWIEDADVEPFGLDLPVKAFFDVFHPRYARFKAPHPVSCDLSLSTLSLYTAVTVADGSGAAYRPTPPLRISAAERGGKLGSFDQTATPGRTKRPSGGRMGSGHGIWRGRALPESRLLYNSKTGATFGVMAGRDFVFSRIEGPTNRSDDMVAASDRESVWIDPGPVQLEDGTWWVIAGRQTPSRPTVGSGIVLVTGAPGLGEMVAFAGTEADGCDTWEDLFPSASRASRAVRRAPPAIRVTTQQEAGQAEPPPMTGDQIRASLLKSG